MTAIEFFTVWVFVTVCIYAGIQIERRLTKKQHNRDIERAYDRGFRAGRNYLDKINVEKTDMQSAMRILTGEEGFDDESFSK